MTIDDNFRHTRLQELSSGDYEIKDGQYDILNREVKDKEEKVIGEVSDLLFDTLSEKVRYIILDLAHNQLNLDERKVMIPIGLARIHEEQDFILLPSISVRQINALPDYERGNVNPGVENMVRLTLEDKETGLTGHPINDIDDNFYDHHHFRDSLFERRGTTNDQLIMVGYFDDSLEAENAVKELLTSGFGEESIDLSSGNLEETSFLPRYTTDQIPGMTNFINDAVTDETDETAEIKSGSVITISNISVDEAKTAAQILDRNGAIKVNEARGE